MLAHTDLAERMRAEVLGGRAIPGGGWVGVAQVTVVMQGNPFTADCSMTYDGPFAVTLKRVPDGYEIASTSAESWWTCERECARRAALSSLFTHHAGPIRDDITPTNMQPPNRAQTIATKIPTETKITTDTRRRACTFEMTSSTGAPSARWKYLRQRQWQCDASSLAVQHHGSHLTTGVLVGGEAEGWTHQPKPPYTPQTSALYVSGVPCVVRFTAPQCAMWPRTSHG